MAVNVTINRIMTLFIFLSISTFMEAQNLKEHVWKDRVILIFTPDEQQADFNKQVIAFNAVEEELKDRDLVLYQIELNGGKDNRGNWLSEQTARQWRNNWNISSDEFKLILIGKDGGRKMIKSEFTEPKVIFDLIDSMPMRRAEMRSKN